MRITLSHTQKSTSSAKRCRRISTGADVRSFFHFYSDFQDTRVVRYFTRIVTVTGCNADVFVVSLAWAMICKFLFVSRQASSIRNFPALISIRSVVIAAISLSVDTAADFNAGFTVSGAAWGHFFFCELGRSDAKESAKYELDEEALKALHENCQQLMRLKNLIAQSLDWELLIPTVAGTFAVLLARLGALHSDCKDCRCINECKSKFMETATPYLETLSYCYVWQGVNQCVLAVACLVLCHGLRRNCSRSFSILSEIKSKIPFTVEAVRSLGIVPCVREVVEEDSFVTDATALILSEQFAAQMISMASEFFPAKAHEHAGEILHQIEAGIDDAVEKENSS